MHDSPTAEVEERLWRDVTGHPLCVVEVEVVVGPVAADGERVGECLARTSGTTHPLLIVEPLGRHVRHQCATQLPDVNADLHCGRYRKDIEFAREAVLGRR